MELPEISPRFPKTKIICTIGPSSWDVETIKKMYRGGMTGARINASFADFEELEKVQKDVKSVSETISVILDTQGHKIRLNKFEGVVELIPGSSIGIGCKKEASNLWVDCPNVLKSITPGKIIRIDNGLFELEVLGVDGDVINCKVLTGGLLTSAKTVNFPDTDIDFPVLTEKDIKDIEFAVEHKFDYISASFIRNNKDVESIKEYLMGSKTRLIAKIENEEGVKNVSEIIEEVDGIMIGRGDLGVESELEKVPAFQKEIIKKCRDRGKLVIVATQMLESMKNSPIPTRAEVSDVANAVYDGADCVMLSAETSVGRYPVESVEWMSKICMEAESNKQSELYFGNTDASAATDAIARSVIDITDELPIDKIIVGSKTGNTLLSISRHHPGVEVIAFLNDIQLASQMNLVFGVRPMFVREKFPTDRDWVVRVLADYGLKSGLLKKEHMIILVTGSGVVGKSRNSIIEVAKVFDICKV